MDGTGVAERRGHARACLTLPVTIRIDGTGEVTRHVTKNISASGIFIDTDDPLPLGTSLSIRIHIPDLNARIQTEGRVVRSQPPGMAIRFIDDALVGLDVLRRLVDG